MPTNKASKVKKAKAGKGKKNADQDSKVDRESEAERAKDNAALWELRLKATKQSLAECEKHCHQLATDNTHLTKAVGRLEKDAVDLTGHWWKLEEAREQKIAMLEEQIRSDKELAFEEKSKMAREQSMMLEEIKKMKEVEARMQQELLNMEENMVIADEEHAEALRHMENKLLQEKARLEKEMTERCDRRLALMEADHRAATAQLEAALEASSEERERLGEALARHRKEAEDLQKLANSQAEENISLALKKDMLEKKHAAQTESQNKKLSKLTAAAASLEQAGEQAAGELAQLRERERTSLLAVQAGQAELERLRKLLALREKELGDVRRGGVPPERRRRELQQFFHEALEHVRREVAASRSQYAREALQDYRTKFREATAGKIKFPPIRTFHKSAHSTNSVYSDMEAAEKWPYPPDAEVELADLTWEQKEKVLRVLFGKMNGAI